MSTEILLVLTNVPDEKMADIIAKKVIETHVAACVNILAPCRSVYQWEGQLETSTEIPLLIKTTKTQYAALEQCIQAHHPYEVPEIIALDITQGNTAYLNWVLQMCPPRVSV